MSFLENIQQSFTSISSIGHLPDDNGERKVKKSFLIYLALFMSGGGLLWGTIALANGLVVQSLIPYTYTLITAVNLYYFRATKNFERVRFVQIFISLILPFLFQWSLGGFFSSGVLMLWALLALVASPSFQTPRTSVIWLVMYAVLATLSAVFEDFFYTLKPDILSDQSLLFVAINSIVIGAIIFFLVVYFVSLSNSAQEKIKDINANLNAQKQEVGLQKEKLEAAIVETNEIISTAVQSGDFNVRMNIDNKEGAWKDLAVSINQLFDAIVSPLTIVKEISKKMSGGDLSHRFNEEANGEILSLKNSMNDSLDQFSELLKDIRLQTVLISESLDEMRNSSKEMSQDSSGIDVAVEEISKGAATQLEKVDQASHLISMIADSAKSIDEQAKAINQKAEEGVAKSNDAIQSVNEMNSLVDETYKHSNVLLKNCEILQEEADRISAFTRVISEIASQTNLLSLNAGIQAADAGDYGKGFGVVAEEIRVLADKARGSVLEIDNLISAVQSKVNETQETVIVVNDSIRKNKDFSSQLENDFLGLASNMKEVMGESKVISESTSRQNDDLKEIVRLTESIVAVAEESAASSKNASDSSKGLADGMIAYSNKNEMMLQLAQELNKKTQKFLLRENE